MWQQRAMLIALVPLLVLAVIATFPDDAFASAHYPVNQAPVANTPPTSKLAASIIIRAYDAAGGLLRNQDFKKVTTNEVFATGPDDLPHYAVYQSTSDGLPSFAVLPQTPYKVYAIWEVPEFGKVMLSADNEGKGYIVDRQGGNLTLNFNYEVAKSKISALRRDSEQFKSQGQSIAAEVADGLSLGEQHLKAAEGRLQLGGSADMTAAVKELNLSLKSSLLAHEQLYLAKADADIEKYRKGNVRLKVVDQEGRPLDNVMVSYKQTSKDFLFSATPAASPYSQLLREAGINTTTAYFNYGGIEPAPGQFDWKGTDGQVDNQLRNGFKPVGNPGWLFFHGWGNNPTETYIPAYLRSMTFEQLKKTVYDHYYALVSRYKGRIDIWDALYEISNPWSNELNWTWQQRLEIFKAATDAVRAADPQAKILSKDGAAPYNHFMGTSVSQPINMNAQAGWIPYSEFLSVAADNQISLDIIGLELPNGSVEVYQTGSPNIHTLLDLTGLSSLLDQYARFSKPLFAIDFHPPSTQIAGGNWWRRPWDEATQAEYAKAVYTIIFSKPLAKGIDWGTGVADDVAGKFGGLTSGLLSADLKPKQSYFALKTLINSWTTTGSGNTDTYGELAFRGFAGDYDVILQTANGQGLKTTLHINEQQTSQMTVTFPLAVPTVAKPVPSPLLEVPPSPKLTTVPGEPQPISSTPAEPQPTVASPVEQATPIETNNIPLIAGGVVGVLLLAGLIILFMKRIRT